MEWPICKTVLKILQNHRDNIVYWDKMLLFIEIYVKHYCAALKVGSHSVNNRKNMGIRVAAIYRYIAYHIVLHCIPYCFNTCIHYMHHCLHSTLYQTILYIAILWYIGGNNIDMFPHCIVTTLVDCWEVSLSSVFYLFFFLAVFI